MGFYVCLRRITMSVWFKRARLVAVRLGPASLTLTIALAAIADPIVRGATGARLSSDAGIADSANEKSTLEAAKIVRRLRVGLSKPGGRYSVVEMNLEDYVARVVQGEGVAGSRPAALEALAIAVRTFAVANAGRHRGDGFDLCDTTHCQVLRAAAPAARRAATATADIVMTYQNKPARVFYSASCGGRSELPSQVWPGEDDPPYLPLRDDAACGGRPEWSVEITERDLVRAFRAAGFEGNRLRELRIDGRTSSGRVARLRVSGFSPDEISGQLLRLAVSRAMGSNLIKSASFSVSRTAGGYRFEGVGSGHGVGMCVLGSSRLAEGGRSATEIIKTYYPGVSMSPFTGPSFAASLPADDRDARRFGHEADLPGMR